MRKYKAAVIGCGWMGVGAGEDILRAKPASHAEAFSMNPRTELVALVDTNKKNLDFAGKLFPGVALFDDTDKMLKETKPDIVTIATDPDSHCKLIKAAARCKIKVIICEKPLSHNLREAEYSVRYAKKMGSILLVDHIRRFDPLIRKYRDYVTNVYVRDTYIGRIRSAIGYYNKGLFHGGTHIIDILIFFLGRVRWVSAVKNSIFTHLKGDINADIFLGFKNAVAAVQAFNPATYTIQDVDFFGERGKLSLRRMGGLEIEGVGIGSRSSADFSGNRELDYSRVLFKEGGKKSMLTAIVEHGIACLENRDKPASSGEDALETLRVLFAIKRSVILEGKKILIKNRNYS